MKASAIGPRAGPIPGAFTRPQESSIIKLICSAYRQGWSASTNALATARLIKHFARTHDVEIVLGTYNADKEVSLSVTGWSSMEEALAAARGVMLGWNQESVLVVDSDSDGTLVFLKGTERLGKMIYSVSDPALRGHNASTKYLNGMYLYAPHKRAQQRVAVQLAA